MTMKTLNLLTSVTAIGAGAKVDASSLPAERTFHASGLVSTGTGSATIAVEGSNDNGLSWLNIGTITLALSTAPVGDGFATIASWGHVRGNVIALSGTGAVVSMSMGA